MTKHFQPLFLSLLFSVSATVLAAQNKGTLHLITCIDIVNDDISQGCRKDHENAGELFKVVAQMGGMNYRPVNLHFDKIEVESYINDFQCGPNDVVVLLYSGHGFRYDNDGDFWPWPFMYFCNREEMDIYSETCELDLEDQYDAIKEKNPRMSIVIGNSCNEVLDDEPAPANAPVALENSAEAGQMFKGVELFTRFQGHIIVSASGPGQKAYTTDENGAYFIVELFKYIAEGLDAEQPTSWLNILEYTKSSVNDRNPDQTPMFKIE